MSRKFYVGSWVILLSCHWRLSTLWKWPPFWLSIKRVRDAGGRSLGFTSLLLGCEFAVLHVAA